MGTNYYAVTNCCLACGRADQQHICQSLVSFESHAVWDDESGSYKMTLTSWAEWREHLRSGVVEHVVDEYGATYDIEDFVAKVEATDREARTRQYGWVATHKDGRDPHRLLDVVGPGNDWLDDDGFSFHGGPFS